MRLMDVYNVILAVVGIILEHRFLLSHKMLENKDIFVLVLIEKYVLALIRTHSGLCA